VHSRIDAGGEQNGGAFPRAGRLCTVRGFNSGPEVVKERS
jgi:hypothetical protein